MTDFYLAEMPVRDDPALTPIWEAITRIDDEHCVELLGNSDLSTPTAARIGSYLLQDDFRAVTLVAVAGTPPEDPELSETGLPFVSADDRGEVLASGGVGLPVRDNLSMAFIDVLVAAAHRRRGIGTALSEALDAIARANGRTKVSTWTGHRGEADPSSPDAVAAPTGVGVLSRSDPTVRFAEALGYRLEQTERHSTLQLPIAAPVLAELREKAGAKAAGYRVLTWQGPTPPEHLDAMAALRRRMSVDIPMGDIEFEEENWDAERLRRSDERQVKLGKTILTAVAQHVASGDLVAFTVLAIEPEKPDVSYQYDTLVHGDHRGHRLGLLVKLANLDQLTTTCPQVNRIHTWNAGENQWMLAINVAMGFARASTEGAWQRHYATA